MRMSLNHPLPSPSSVIVSRSSSLVVVVVDDDVFLISSFQMQFMLLFSRQGKLRLQKWYVPLSDKEKKKITRELVQTVLARKPKMCSFLEWRDLKVVYKRCVEMRLVREQDAFWLNGSQDRAFPHLPREVAVLSQRWRHHDNTEKEHSFCLVTATEEVMLLLWYICLFVRIPLKMYLDG